MLLLELVSDDGPSALLAFDSLGSTLELLGSSSGLQPNASKLPNIIELINSGFNIVERCVLTPDSIRVSLSQPLKGYITLNASFELPLPTAQFAELQQMLNRIFAEHENLLVIETQL